MNTAFHYSSLVVSREVFEKSIECFADGNPYDTDRLISVEMGKYGSVAFITQPHVCISYHDQQEGVRLRNSVGDYWWEKTNTKLLDYVVSNKIDLTVEYGSRMKDKLITFENLKRQSNPISIKRLSEMGVFNDESSMAVWSRIKILCEDLLPPLALRNARKLKRVFRKPK